MDSPDHPPGTDHPSSTMTSRGCFYTGFPEELDLHVGHFVGNYEDSSDALKTLRTLALTSRDFHRLFNPLLYKASQRNARETKQAGRQNRVFFSSEWRKSAMDWASAYQQPATVALVCEHAPSLLKMRHFKEAVGSNRLDITELMLGQESFKEKLRLHKHTAWKTPMFAVAEQGSLKIATMITEICAPMDHNITLRGRSVLHVACETGHVNLVRFFLDQGADLNIPTPMETPLALAIQPKIFSGFAAGRRKTRARVCYFGIIRYSVVEQGFIDVVKEILSRNPMLDQPEQYLTVAVQAGRADIFDLLLKHGINFSSQGSLDRSLHDAIYSGSLALVQRLLELGARVLAIDPADGDEEGPLDDEDDDLIVQTALQAVAIGKLFHGGAVSVAMADLLLKHGAAVEHPHIHRGARDLHIFEYERSPLRLSLDLDDVPLVERLLQANAHLVPHQICPMYFVRSVEAVHVLEKYGLDINEPGVGGSFPLIIVTRRCRGSDRFPEKTRVLEYLANNVADINVTDSLGKTALSHCCATIFDRSRYLSFLLDRNANPNIPDSEGQTALHKAVKYGHRDMVTLLAEHGANVNAGDHTGSTPLHELMKEMWIGPNFYYKINIAEILLLQFKADPDARSHNGTHAIYVPVNDWITPTCILHLLWLYSRCKSSDEIHPYKPFSEHARSLISLKNLWTDVHVAALINRRDDAGNLTLVRIAGGQEPPDIPPEARGRSILSKAKLILNLGADFTEADGSGTTPLQAAISAGNNELRDHLLSLGAST